MISIYIAGPMTDLPEFNFPAFNRAEDYLKSTGFTVTNPAKLHDHTDHPWEFYMRSAVSAMLQCDMVYMLVGWSSSRGACIELNLAQQLGMGVMYEADNEKFLSRNGPLPTTLKV